MVVGHGRPTVRRSRRAGRGCGLQPDGRSRHGGAEALVTGAGARAIETDEVSPAQEGSRVRVESAVGGGSWKGSATYAVTAPARSSRPERAPWRYEL